MARAKKETALTPEERLQAALVPDWERPYKLPENWCWTYFKSISTIQTGKKDANYGSDEGKYPFFTCAAEPIRCHGYSFDCRAILLAGNGDINNISRYNGKFEAYQRTYVVKIAEPLCFDYIFYWFKYRWFDFNKGKMFGTAIPYIRLGNLQEFPTPIPPLAEQQRIVDRIESLFAKLDEAKEKAQAVVDSFETRKAAILHKAFTGELTAKWREEHGVRMESWHLRTIGEVCENVKVGIVIKPSQYYVPQNEGTPAFRSANVRECRIDDFNWVYLNEKGMKDNSRSIVHTGDVLVVRSGNPGTACVVPERFDGCNAIDILIAVPNKKIIISDYLCYYTNSPLGKKTVEIGKRGIALTHFNVKGFSQMSINIPTIPEQVVIVRTLGDLFAQEQQAKEAAEAVLDQIDLMKKSILARAFRGELGTNDPSEESAVKLLKQII